MDSDYLGENVDIRPADCPELIADRYEIGEWLGEGAFGRVYRARDRLTGHLVAVKLSPATPSARREVVALRLLKVPGVVRLIDEGQHDGLHFMVTEHVIGVAFPDFRAPQPWAQLAPLTRQLIKIVARVHQLDALHLDLKPHNVLVRADGTVVVLDWGLAGGAFLGQAASESGGTRRYASPERVQGTRVDARSDLYSLGVMLTDAMSAAPEHVAAVLRDMTSHAPEARPPSAHAAFERLFGSELSWTPPAAGVGASSIAEWFTGAQAILPITQSAERRLLLLAGDDPGARKAEVNAWLAAGLASDHDGQLKISVEGLTDLEMDLPYPVAPSRRLRVPDVPAPLHAALETLTVAWPLNRLSTLEQITPGLIGAAEQLCRRGLAIRLPEGRLRPLVRTPVPAHRKVVIHRQLAGLFAKGSVPRCFHLAHAGAPRAAQDEAIDASQRMLQVGALAHARRLLFLAQRLQPAQPTQAGLPRRLLLTQTVIALETRTDSALHEALYTIGRFGGDAALERLLRVAQLAGRGEPQRAHQLLERTPRFESPLLERWRVGLRLKTASLFGPEAEALAFQSLQSEVGGAAAHRVDGWRGRLAYREGQYERAARLHLRAADAASDEAVRMSHLLNAGSACLESDDLARVEAIAARVHDFAVPRRLPYFASRAIWLQRAALYRAGRAGAPRPELAAEAVELAPRAYAGLIALTEATVAWRERDIELAARLANQAALSLKSPSTNDGYSLARALAIACTSDGVSADLPGLIQTARAMNADVGFQILGLLAQSQVGLREEAAALAQQAGRPKARRDVLSPCEVIEAR